jgi:hypothetical protein
MHVTDLVHHWQRLLAPFADAFTFWGFRRVQEWLTGLVLNVEEHTITQSLVGLGLPQDWKAVEAFAEYGRWDQDTVGRVAAQLIDQAPERTWYGYRVWAGDDTKVHRSSKHVWGTCTFHEYTARCPNRAGTVRADNWVVLGALLPRPGQPAGFLPHTGRLYFRQSQLPAGETFRTKCALLVEQLQREARWIEGNHLGVFEGAFAVRSVVRPLVCPPPGQRRVEFLTRLRADARLHARPEPSRPAGRRWPGAWQTGRAWIYGRWRAVRSKEVVCWWRVSGHDVPVKAVVAQVDGYRKRCTVASSACQLTGVQRVEIFAARFREEDGFRDLKQRLGWEECRAWTKNPIVRTTQRQLLAMTLVRWLQFRLEEAEGDRWWYHPPWNKRKARPSVLDLERLLGQHRREIPHLLCGAGGTGGN